MAELSSAEWNALGALDDCCYKDSERGGQGWVSIQAVADRLGVSDPWAGQLLLTLATRGLVERYRSSLSHRLFYALSDQGGKLLLASTREGESR